MPDLARSIERQLGDLEARVTTLESEVQRIRDWRHDLPAQLIIPVQEQLQDLHHAIRDLRAVIPSDGLSGERRHLTMRDMWIAGASIAATCAVLQFLGLIHRVT